MRIGGLSPFPIRLGGGPSTTEVVYRSLNDQLGTAYDTSDESTVTAETMSEARAIAAAWSANRRLSYQWDPRRLTDMLSRWERIFGVVPLPTDSEEDRRNRLVPKFLALAAPIYATIWDACSNILGDAFISVEYTTAAQAHSQWPGSTPAVANGWTSSLAHILVRCANYADIGMTWQQELTLIGQCRATLNDMLPADVTFDFAGYNSLGQNNFLLDEPNLDWLSFGS